MQGLLTSLLVYLVVALVVTALTLRLVGPVIRIVAKRPAWALVVIGALVLVVGGDDYHGPIIASAGFALMAAKRIWVDVRRGRSGAPERVSSSPFAEQRTALYRFYDALGRLLYVGIACNEVRRALQHRSRAPWADQVHNSAAEYLPSRALALAAERSAIDAEHPVHNDPQDRARCRCGGTCGASVRRTSAV